MSSNRIQLVVGGLAIMLAATAWGYAKSMYPYTMPAGAQGAELNCVRAQPGMQLELGKWYTNFEVCKKYADDNGLPLLAVWSNHGCVHCWYTDIVFVQPEFVAWQKTHDAGQVICCYMAGGDDDIDQVNSAAYKWMWYGGGTSINAYPFVVMWWQKAGINRRMDGDTFCKGSSSAPLSFTEATYPARVVNVENILSTVFKDWKADIKPPYSGGASTIEETEGNRLEAEAGTTAVSLELVRAEDAAEFATNNLVVLIGPDGGEVATQTVEWEEGQTNQTVTVDISGVAFAKDGDKALLVVKAADGTVQGTNSVTYVDAENSAYNPLWIGERRATANRSDKPVLAWGEWTMDLDVAKEKVASEDGDAYTLVDISGSLWCPDCANVERNFASVKNGSGKNRLAEWAEANKVAFVSIDVPRFETNTVESTRPTLLSRKAYETTLARAKEYPASGADSSLTNAMLRSGLGYLTRKGVSDDEALAVLERNRKLVSKNTAEGGFHRPEDSNAFRTGVPIFVMLRKDGSVAARLTRFASVSPMADANWDDLIKRFDEMIVIAKATDGEEHYEDIENTDASTTPLSFKANGGSAAGEISHTDFQDVFRLEGVGGNALQKVVVTGACDAVVSVQFMKMNAEGKSETVGTAATGSLSAGVSLEETFTEAGDFFVKVSGGDISGGSFTVANPTDGNFAAFTVAGTVVLVPQEVKAEGSAPEGSDKVTMRLKSGQMYRIEGLRTDAVGDVFDAQNPSDPYCLFYTAKVDGDVPVTTAYKGGTVTHQKWVPSSIGFVAATKTVKEGAGRVSIALSRTGGKSGVVTVRVSLDEENTTLYNSEDEPKFEFDGPIDLIWGEGQMHTTNMVVNVLEDERFDGAGDVALKIELVSDENGDTVLTQTNYVLTVTENDKQAAGKVMFSGADPFFSKKATVYAREGEGAIVYAKRVEASDGKVTVNVKATNGAKLVIGEEETSMLTWANHKYEPQAIKVTGLAAGKTATLTLENPTDGLKVLSASNRVTVVSVADNAPAFEAEAGSATFYRYVSKTEKYPVTLAAGVEGAKLTFTKLSGTLPAGLKAIWDEESNALAICGATTAKAGVYPIVYQVTQQVGTTKTPGLAIALLFTVVDPTDAVANPEEANASVAKARTFKDVPIVNNVNHRLTGTLQITIPTRGNVSAKYACESGVIALSAKAWDDFTPGTKDLHATAMGKNGFVLEVICEDDGDVTLSVTDPMYEGVSLDAVVQPANAWSKESPASAWQGYYTVALVPDLKTIDEDTEGLAPRGSGYLTLKMNTAAAWNAGKVTWAGMLPNGMAISGSSVLSYGDATWAKLPVFKVSSSDTVSVLAKIRANAVADGITRAVLSADGVTSCWVRNEKDDSFNADYLVDLGVYGGPYLTTIDLAACCEEDYETTSPTLKFGDGAAPDATVAVGPKTLSLKNPPAGTTLRLAFNTGVVSGTVKVADSAGKQVSAAWKGVILQGWGPGCGCGPSEDGIYLPFVNGAYYFDDKVQNEGGKTLKVKRGGSVAVE